MSIELVMPSVDHEYMGLFLDSQFYSTDLCVFSHARATLSDDCRFLVSSKIRKYESSNLVLFQDCFSYFECLAGSPLSCLIQSIFLSQDTMALIFSVLLYNYFFYLSPLLSCELLEGCVLIIF